MAIYRLTLLNELRTNLKTLNLNEMIKADNITISYNDLTPLQDFSFEIPTNAKCVLTGPSGKGKSSLLNSIAGFVTPTKGKLYIQDLEINEHNIAQIRKTISYLPQELNIDLPSCKQLLYYPFTFKVNKSIKPTDNEVKQILEKLLLPADILEKQLSEISGGQKQRLALASILLLKRPILLLDEPTSALDDASTNAVIDTIQALKQVTVISASHDSRWIEKMNLSISL